MNKVIGIDIETTGLDREKDEILQVSICDINGRTLLNMYIRPTEHTEWPEAMAVNGITPESLVGMPTWEEAKEQVQRVINLAEEIITYNGNYFDIPFLENKGIKFDHIAVRHDVMEMFSIYRGVPNEKGDGFKRFKLTTAAEHFNFNFKAHDSEQDTKATVFVFNAIRDFKARKMKNCFWELKEDDYWATGCGYKEYNDKAGVRSVEDKIIFGNWRYCPICGKMIITK